MHSDTQSDTNFFFFGKPEKCAHYKIVVALGAGDARALCPVKYEEEPPTLFIIWYDSLGFYYRSWSRFLF